MFLFSTDPFRVFLQIQAAEQIMNRVINDEVSNYLVVPFSEISILGIYHAQEEEEDHTINNLNMRRNAFVNYSSNFSIIYDQNFFQTYLFCLIFWKILLCFDVFNVVIAAHVK